MIIYNITFNTDKSYLTHWSKYIQANFIPQILKTGFFVQHKKLKLLNEVSGLSGETYAIQFYAKELIELENFRLSYENAVLTELRNTFQDHVMFFITILEEID